MVFTLNSLSQRLLIFVSFCTFSGVLSSYFFLEYVLLPAHFVCFHVSSFVLDRSPVQLGLEISGSM